jgi:hypothetical protein
MVLPTTRQHLAGLATALSVLLSMVAVCSLLALVAPDLQALSVLFEIAIAVVFIVWLYRARGNAEWSRVPQRRARGWAIGAWFVPVVNLWFPLQLVEDIWHAGVDAAPRSRMPWQVGTWWACWLLAWITSYHTTHVTVVEANGRTAVNRGFALFLGTTPASKVFVAAAAILMVIVVRAISMRQARPLDA